MGAKGIMKEVKRLIGMGVITAVMMMAVGCGGDIAEKKLSDTENINQLISGQYAEVFGSDIRVGKPVEDQESVGERLSKQAAIPVPSWHRTIERPISRNISITQTEDTAEVTVSSTINGTLDINTNADNNIVDFAKIIKDTANRSAIFKRNESGKWELAEVSPIEFSLRSGEAPVVQTIQIASVEVSKFDDTTQSWSIVWPPETKRPLTDPATKLLFSDELPTFNPGNKIKVEVMITNADSNGAERDSYCYLHHDSQRDFMYDDGVNEGDALADDNIFTAEYSIGNGTGYSHAAVDCIDGATLQDYTQDNYNAEAWGLPYKVE